MFLKLIAHGIKQFFAHKLYSLINILGLSIGLAVCLLIFLFVLHETTYDQHYENSDRLALVYQSDMEQGDSIVGNSSVLLASQLELDFEEVEAVARIGRRDTIVGYNKNNFTEAIEFADPEFFVLYDFDWLQGRPETALIQPGSLVVTESFARRYFGGIRVVGETLLFDNEYPMQVSGVIADLPSNTHLNLNAIASLSFFLSLNKRQGLDLNNWGYLWVTTYALMKEPGAMERIRARLSEFAERHTGGGERPPRNFSILPVTDLYLHHNFGSGDALLGNLVRVQIFTTIALSILLIAVINFINLSTARWSWRAKEVGINMVIGAGRAILVGRFLAEALIMVAGAAMIATLISELFLPLLNAWLNISLTWNLVLRIEVLITLLAGVVGIGLVAGSYPAFYLSAVKPTRVLKGEVASGKAGATLRNLLVVFQFAIAIVLIVVSISVFEQMRYIRGFNPGFSQELMVTMVLPEEGKFNVNNLWPAFKSELESRPEILSATHAISTPLLEGRWRVDLIRDRGQEGREATMIMMERDFLDTYQINVIAGRGELTENDEVSIQDLPVDALTLTRGGIILNELAARNLGWSPQQAVGQNLRVGIFQSGAMATVIGVVENTVTSVRDRLEPLIYITPETFNYGFMRGLVSIKLSGRNLNAALAHIDETWTQFMGNEPINRQFLDAQIAASYQPENLQMKLFTVAACIAVIIACFGLYGLAAFNTERRTKEIGVRKVVGGSVWQIVLLLTNDFSKLVLAANLIAWPVAYFSVNRWLENFAYRIDVTPLIFVGSGLIALCIAWVTVGGTAAKAASAKPVLALRYE